MCVWLGHTHPLGVLHYTTYGINGLACAQLMTCNRLTCRAVKAMELHKEAMVVRATAPSAIHVRAYMTMVGGEPPKTLSPPSEGEQNLICPLVTPNQVEELHIIFKWSLVTSLTKNYISSWRISARRLQLHEPNAPPRSPPPRPWEKSTREWKSKLGWPGGHLS